MKAKSTQIIFYFLACFFFQTTVGFAQAGTQDSTFDQDGKVVTELGPETDIGCSVAIQSDGKIVVAGSTLVSSVHKVAVLRYKTNGSLDSTFDSDGIVITDVSPGYDSEASSVAIQPDGKIVIGGTENVRSFVARYNTDGSLDNTFDGDGIAKIPFGTSSTRINALRLQPDGKILAAGLITVAIFNNAFAAARLNADGSLDNSFNGNGKVITDIGSGNDEGLGAAIQADGKIILVGLSFRNSTNLDFALVRYNTNGSPDSTFDADGIVRTTIGIDAIAFGVAVQANGKIVVAGARKVSSNFDFTTVRYNTNGSLDSTFDADGIAVRSFGNGDDMAGSVLVQPNGKIISGGRTANSSLGDFALVCYNTNGSLDSTFSGDGVATTPFGAGSDFIMSLALQADGKIVAAGCANNSPNGKIAVARYYSSQDVSVPEIYLNDNSIIVFPNPFADQTTIYSEEILNNATLIVSNIFGQVVAGADNISGHSIPFYRENLSGGLYFIRIITGKKIFTGKVLINGN